jgi:hypothetical protein
MYVSLRWSSTYQDVCYYILTARAIPDIAVKHASEEQLAIDPVSQYVFMQLVPTIPITSQRRRTLWWQAYPMIPSLLVGRSRRDHFDSLRSHPMFSTWICGSSEEGDN